MRSSALQGRSPRIVGLCILLLTVISNGDVLCSSASASPLPRGTEGALRDAALAGDTVAWNIVEGLTTEVGPRLAASDQEVRARTWAVDKLKSLGFRNVHIEPFEMPVWVRGA
jgi:carboxypeptidase Q